MAHILGTADIDSLLYIGKNLKKRVKHGDGLMG